jgi:hypothetical protein
VCFVIIIRIRTIHLTAVITNNAVWHENARWIYDLFFFVKLDFDYVVSVSLNLEFVLVEILSFFFSVQRNFDEKMLARGRQPKHGWNDNRSGERMTIKASSEQHPQWR